MLFRLTTLFYLTALTASALAAFGVWGLLAVAAVPFLRSCWEWLCHHAVLVMVILVIGAIYRVFVYPMTLPNVPDAIGPESPIRVAVMGQILEALREEIPRPQTGTVPAGSQYPQSWRTATIPYIDLTGVKDYRLEEPWNSPHNLQIAQQFSAYPMGRPRFGPPATLLAVSDPRTAWPPRGLLPRDAIGDGDEYTICAIDSADKGILWTEPRDLTFDEAVALLTTRPEAGSRDWHVKDHGYFYFKQRYRMLLMCSGRVVFLNAPLDRATAVAMLTANGREPIYWHLLPVNEQPQLNLRKVIGLVMFLTLAAMSVHPQLRETLLPRMQNSEQVFEGT